MGRSRLEDRFIFYGSYHDNAINQLIHMCMVPVIVWASAVLLSQIPVYGAVNGAHVMAVVYCLYYLSLSVKLGIPMSCLVIAEAAGALYFVDSYGPDAWKVAVWAEVIGWGAQFVGHGVFEGRAPALLDNLADSLLVAPLFVFLETAMKFGFFKEFHAQTALQIKANVAAFRKSKGN